MLMRLRLKHLFSGHSLGLYCQDSNDNDLGIFNAYWKKITKLLKTKLYT